MSFEEDFDYPAGTDSFCKAYPSGTYFDPTHFTAEMVHLNDIAHALSQVNRYGGHTPSAYTVAEHCLHVSAYLWRTTGRLDLALAGLLHDAAEAYIGDMVRPLKIQRAMSEFKVTENRIMVVIEKVFNLDELTPGDWACVETVDHEILGWEMAMVNGAPWRTPTPAAVVEKAFLDRANHLGKRLWAREPHREVLRGPWRGWQ